MKFKHVILTTRQFCLPDKLDSLVASGENGLAGYKEGGFSVDAFIHHQDHVEKSVEHPTQGLDNSHISLDEINPLSYTILMTLI